MNALLELPDLSLDGGVPGACGHPATDFLGSNQGAIFLRRLLCGVILVQQGGHAWVFPPATGLQRFRGHGSLGTNLPSDARAHSRLVRGWRSARLAVVSLTLASGCRR